MNNPAYICIIFGVFVIIFRGPLIFRPQATKEAYRKMFATRARVRLTGLVVLVLGAAMALAARQGTGPAATFFTGFGCVLAVLGALVSTVLPAFFKIFIDTLIDAFDDLMLRGVGVFAVAVGALLVWLGISMLG